MCRNSQTPLLVSFGKILTDDICNTVSIICDINLAGVSLWPGSESRRPMILQVISTSATRQKMKQLVPYMIIAGTLNTETNIKICVE